ncbi:MAG: PAS domain S-box protein [Pseudomonadales bacterium]|nr:PAS domain S-box protein [Pseudomonadales bacterium]
MTHIKASSCETEKEILLSRIRRILWQLLIGVAAFFSPSAFAVDITNDSFEFMSLSPILISLLATIITIQTIIIFGLQRSRLKNKKAKQHLSLSHKELEKRVDERTERLSTTNERLQHEVSRHELTEALLQETKEYLNSIINSMPSILIGVTPTGYVTHWNASAVQATDIQPSRALGSLIDEIYPDISVSTAMIIESIQRGIPQTNENIQQGDGNEARFMDVTVFPLISSEITGAVIRVDDVTVRVKLENMMVQNEKMMSLGELAAGMAHEINNPLSVVLQGIQNILRRTSPAIKRNLVIAQECGTELSHIHDYLTKRDIYRFLFGVQEAGERAAAIVTNMLEFSRSNTRQHIPVDLRDLLNHSLDLAANTFDLKSTFHFRLIDIEKDFDSTLPPVPCTSAEIQQIILNLLKNAAQALANDSRPNIEPRITLRTRKFGNFAQIDVIDNGPGMDSSIAKRIFEPFFTTKGIGQGTGLGLSVCYFIVTDHHGGTIEVDSTRDEGTTFTIKLPLTTSKLALASPTD